MTEFPHFSFYARYISNHSWSDTGDKCKPFYGIKPLVVLEISHRLQKSVGYPRKKTTERCPNHYITIYSQGPIQDGVDRQWAPPRIPPCWHSSQGSKHPCPLICHAHWMVHENVMIGVFSLDVIMAD